MNNIKIGCQVLSWGSKRIINDLNTVLFEAKTANFEGIEIGTRFLGNLSPLTFKSLLEEKGLVLSGLHTGLGSINVSGFGDINQLGRDKLLSNFERAINFAKEVGTSNLIVSGWNKEEKSEEDFNLLVEILNEIGSMCKKNGITLCYHNHNWEIENGMYELKKLVDSLEPEIFSLAPDLGWVEKGGENSLKFIKSFISRIKYFHLRDISNGDFVELGKGRIDYINIFNFLRENNWQGWIVAEVVGPNDSPFPNPFESVSRARTYLKDILGI